ncbi:MAG: hypothetical protein QM804_02505 [Propionicimonas sp.]
MNDSVGSSKLDRLEERNSRTSWSTSGSPSRTWSAWRAGLDEWRQDPVRLGAACFLTARAMEQIKVDLAYAPAMSSCARRRPGVGYGALGATHHSIEDVAWMRTIPGMTVLVPADPRGD